MKLSALLAVTLLAVAPTYAAECSTQRVKSLQTSTEYKTMQTTDCSVPPAKNSDCTKNTCLLALEAVVKILPDDCMIQGVIPQAKFADQFAQLKRQCETESGASSVSGINSTTPVATPSNRVPKCTSEQLSSVMSHSDKAQRAACDSPLGTDPATSAKKICAKPCQDEYEASLAAQPNCTTGGINYRDQLVENFDQIKDRCRLLAKENGAPAIGETSKAPAITTKAPASSAATTKAPASSAASLMTHLTAVAASVAVAALGLL